MTAGYIPDWPASAGRRLVGARPAGGLGPRDLTLATQVASCGGCDFSTNATGHLTRNTCDPASCTSSLGLSNKSITSLDQGVFSGLQINVL